MRQLLIEKKNVFWKESCRKFYLCTVYRYYIRYFKDIDFFLSMNYEDTIDYL